MHPGANVGMDLILWMGLITTGLFAMAAGVQNLNWYDNEYSYSGETTSSVRNPDGTYSSISGHYGYFQNGTYGFVPDGTPGADCPGYATCALKAAATSRVHHLGAVEVVGCAFTFLAVYVPPPAFLQLHSLMTTSKKPPPLYPLRLGLRRRPPPQQRKSRPSRRRNGAHHHHRNGRTGRPSLRPAIPPPATTGSTLACSRRHTSERFFAV